MNLHKSYLGDGVYVSFDGYQIVLAVNTPENIVVYLDDYVSDALIDYINTIKKLRNETSNKSTTESS